MSKTIKQNKPKKNYNHLSLKGIEIDDMEFVKHFNLPPNLAYTPELNEAILQKVYTDYVKSFMKIGEKENAAKMKAGRLRAEARAEIASRLA